MKPDVDKTSFDLNFEFPRPREQGLADTDILFSTETFGNDKIARQKDVIGVQLTSPNVYVKLIRAVLKDKDDKNLQELIDDCGGVETLASLNKRRC